MLVGVIGQGKPSEKHDAVAEQIGVLIAQHAATLVCGGRGGVMMAAARGAQKNGGLTVGILPGENPADANPYIDIALATDMGHARNAIIARSCDALIAVGGEYGTLSEIALALKMGKTVVGVDTWDIPGVVKADTAEDAVNKALGVDSI